jgi:molybdopterin-guanine dinucleotide biosynthesis protein A
MTSFDGVAGIFVGGRGSRLGGLAKGLLKFPGDTATLVERLTQKLHDAGVDTIVLVGKHPAYVATHLSAIADAADGLGPMAGLLSLVRHTLGLGRTYALAVACDMPYLDVSVLQALCRQSPEAVALVPKRDSLEPLCARYHAAAIEPLLAQRLSGRNLSIVAMLRGLHAGCIELPIDRDLAASLNDWDEPDDLPDALRQQLGASKPRRE